MDKPLVDVIIPVFNYAGKVTKAIQSVMDQTVTNLHCYIVDDGSTDDSAQVIKEFIKSDDRFSYIYKPNGGVATARNLGVEQGNAPFVCCLDADDRIAPIFLETCVDKMMEDRTLAIAYTGLWYTTPDGNEGLSQWPGDWDFDKALKGQNQVPTCCVIRREVWERLGGQRQRFAPEGAGEEDAEFWLRAGAYGYRAEKVTGAGLFLYSWQSGRVSGNKSHKITDYRAWHPWIRDGKHPFASWATPNRISHPVKQYDEPIVSVIIPVGPNHTTDVINALDSLDAQTFRGWEGIVVWDAGGQYGEAINDHTLALHMPTALKKLNRVFPHIQFWINGEGSRGAGYSRNKGAELARAPLLLFLDADDWLYPDCIDKMANVWMANPAIVYSDYVGLATVDDPAKLKKDVDADPFRTWLRWDERRSMAAISHQSADYDCDRAAKQPDRKSPYLWNLVTSLVPKAWHEEIGGFDENMPSWEDWDYYIRMARAGKCFYRIPEELVVYQYSTGNRRHTGLQLKQSLLEYLETKYKGEPTMPCSGCGKSRKANPLAQPQGAMAQSINKNSNLIADTDMIECLYDHPNKGQHGVRGMGTGTFYGYRKGGDVFLVHQADIEKQPHVFKPREVEQFTGPTQPVTPPPPPKHVVEKPKKEEIKKTPPPQKVIEVPDIVKEVMESTPAVEVDLTKRADLGLLPGVTPDILRQFKLDGIENQQQILDLGKEGLKKYKGIGDFRAETILKFISGGIEL